MTSTAPLPGGGCIHCRGPATVVIENGRARIVVEHRWDDCPSAPARPCGCHGDEQCPQHAQQYRQNHKWAKRGKQ